jgi:hypothetical protein
MALRIRRGTNAQRLTITPEQGELVYTTDTKSLYVGDGVTVGGNPAVAPTATTWGSIIGTLTTQTDLTTYLGANYQPLDADLTAIAALSTTSFGRGLLTETSAATLRSTLSLVVGTNVQAWDGDLDAIAALSGTTGLLRKTAANTWSLDTNTYLTANQSISISGDATGTGTTSIALTLATVNANTGTFNNVTVNAKGLVTAASNVAYLTGNQTITFSGDASGSGTTAITLTLANVNSNTGTFNNVTVNAKGLVTAASNVAYLTSYTETDPVVRALTGVVIGNSGSAITAVAGTANQLLRRNAGNTAYEFFTPAYLTANQTITLSGDVTGSGATAITTSIANSAVTYAKIQNVTAARLLGRHAASAGLVQEISIGSGLSLDSATGVLSATGGGGGSLPSGGLTGYVLTKNSATDGDASFLRPIGVNNIEVFTTGTTWTIPAGVRRFKVTLIGGGGQGGGTQTTAGQMGAGGGSGALVIGFFDVEPGQTSVSYTIGAGGSSAGTNATGQNGTASTLTYNGVTWTAGGGSGGTTHATANGGGNGGTATAVGADLTEDGNKGRGGGTSSGSTATGFTGQGANTPMGYGAGGDTNGTAAGGNGLAGQGYGAGGSGGRNGTGTTARSGGAGTAGILIIEY